MNPNLNYIIGGLVGIVLVMIFGPFSAIVGVIAGGLVGEYLDNRKPNVP
jgi:hypothetical protein